MAASLDQSYWDDDSCELAAAKYADSRDALIVRRLGAGVDGFVVETDRGSAIKIARTEGLFDREKEVYLRLFEREIRSVEGFAVPLVYDADDSLRAIEMEIVRPPYCLDFATVTLDSPPDWDEERAEAFDESLVEFFGDEADRVRSVIASFMAFGVYLTDPHPGNIRLR